MRRGIRSAAIVAGVAFAGAAVAATPPRPSDRACLLAWNAPANHANRAKLIAARPMHALALRAGLVGVDAWTKGTTTSTETDACLLEVAKARTSFLVTGAWTPGGVARWSWGRTLPAPRFVAANVRLLADGRVTKIDGR